MSDDRPIGAAVLHRHPRGAGILQTHESAHFRERFATPYGGMVLDSALALGRCVENSPGQLRGIKAIELGDGTGCLGSRAARGMSGAHISTRIVKAK